MSYEVGPYDRKFVQLVWGGTLPGNEEWCCSLKLSGGSEGEDVGVPGADNELFMNDLSPAVMTTWLADSVTPAVKAYHARAGTKISFGAKLEYVKLNPMLENGHYRFEQSFEDVFAPIAGGGDAFGVPNQISLCVSLLTAVTRGPGHRGRFYLPCPALLPSTTDGLITTAEADAVKDSTITFLHAIADIPGIDTPNSAEPVVMSRKAGSPRTRHVTGIAIGRCLDTQRRRRRSLPENYRLATVDFGAA